MIGYAMVIYDYEVPEYDIRHLMIDRSEQGAANGNSSARSGKTPPSLQG